MKINHYLKHIVYFIIFYSGLLGILIIIHRRCKKKHKALILFYHRFCREGNEEKLLPHLDVRDFEKQLIWVKKQYNVIAMDELASTIVLRDSFKKPSVAITIDDGYLDNYLLAYPIFIRQHIPVLIYLTVGLIGTKESLWVDDIEYALTHSTVREFCLKELGNETIDVSYIGGRKRAEKKLFSKLVKIENGERQILINKLLDALKVDKTKMKERLRIMLNWEEVLEMWKNGVSFGAHTVTHPRLSIMSTEAAKSEIERSKEILENRLGISIKHFAVPNGEANDFTGELEEFCKKIGFDTVVSTEFGVIDSNASRFWLRRVLPAPPLYYFACEIARFFFLRK